MNEVHKAIRAHLRTDMPKTMARTWLNENLPIRESDAIYFCDVEQESVTAAARRLGYSPDRLKKLRQCAYIKLAALLRH